MEQLIDEGRGEDRFPWPVFLSLVSFFIGMTLFLIYLYRKLIGPFQGLEDYAKELARGNFDVELPFEKDNYFGSFTWAFDSMRGEIIAARKSEAEAIAKNKLIISGLSHDIKTPISSIRAYSEALEANITSDSEKKRKYLEVIIRKCDEVSRLTDDLLLHALSEMDKLKVNEELLDIELFCRDMAKSYGSSGMDLDYRHKGPKGRLVSLDRMRLEQVFDNILRNAEKYGEMPVTIRLETGEEEAVLVIRDSGPGIPPEDMPFIFDKFYRGHNSADKEGSGLGLYIVRHLVERMHGRIELDNSPTGLGVHISFPLIS